MAKDAGARFQCKLCPRNFQMARGLGSHMRAAHGIAGTAKSTVSARERNEAIAVSKAPKVPIQQNIGGKMKCPECGKTCANRAAFANHRRAAHGVKSKAQLVRERRAEKSGNELAISVPVPTIAEEKIIEKRKPEIDGAGSSVDPLVFAIALGQVKELCRHIAEEHGVPTKLFTRQFSQLFLAEARR